jgi:hypothetical protein
MAYSETSEFCVADAQERNQKCLFAVEEASIGSGLGPHLSSSTLTAGELLKGYFYINLGGTLFTSFSQPQF